MWLWLLACTKDSAEPTIAVDPPSGPLSGYYPVSIDLSAVDVDASDVTEVRVGANRAIQLAADGDAVTFTVQGSPDPGPQDVVLVAGGKEHRYPGAFSYDPPKDHAFDRVFAMGASLTEGVQGGVPTQHGNLHAPALQIARQLGAYMGMPVLVDPLFPPIGWSDLGPPPDCAVPDVVAHVAAAAASVLGTIADDSGNIDFARARLDPDLEIRDVAVGGSRVADLLTPPADFGESFVLKMVYEPHAGLSDPVTTAQIDLAEQLQPTLVIVTDTYGNDLINALLTSTPAIDMSAVTPPDQLRADLGEVADRLSATGAEVFLANLPRASLLPVTVEKRAAWIAGGGDPAEIDADIAQVDAMGDTYRQILDDVASSHPQVHVVDLYGRVAEIEQTGLEVAGHTLTVGKFGGLLGTDGVHFGDVGYGLLAQAFTEEIAKDLGVDLDPVDLDPLYADDPFSPDAMAAAGLDPSKCQ